MSHSVLDSIQATNKSRRVRLSSLYICLISFRCPRKPQTKSLRNLPSKPEWKMDREKAEHSASARSRPEFPKQAHSLLRRFSLTEPLVLNYSGRRTETEFAIQITARIFAAFPSTKPARNSLQPGPDSLVVTGRGISAWLRSIGSLCFGRQAESGFLRELRFSRPMNDDRDFSQKL